MAVMALLPSRSASCVIPFACRLPVGSVTILLTPIDAGSLILAAQLRSINPWAPLCVLTESDAGIPGTAEHVFTAFRRTTTADLASSVLAAARLRAVPSVHQILQYVTRRAPILGRAMRDAVEAEAWRTNRIRRSLRWVGSWTPHDCRMVVDCVRALAHGVHPGSNEERAAGDVGLSRKTISRYVRAVFSVGYAHALGFRVWEAWIEQALRCADYIAEQYPLADARHEYTQKSPAHG